MDKAAVPIIKSRRTALPAPTDPAGPPQHRQPRSEPLRQGGRCLAAAPPYAPLGKGARGATQARTVTGSEWSGSRASSPSICAARVTRRQRKDRIGTFCRCQNSWPIRPARPWREFATCASCPARRRRASKQLGLDKRPAMAQMSTARMARYGQGAGTGFRALSAPCSFPPHIAGGAIPRVGGC